MGEIDTKSIESVQTVITFFGQSNDQKKNSPTKDDEHQEAQAVKKEREVEGLEKELASAKVQLESKDNAFKQALVMIDHHQETADDLSILLQKSDLQKDFYINESREAKTRVNELEFALEQTAHRLSESEKAQEQMMNMETELALLREVEMESSSQIKALDRALNDEKLQKEELLTQLETMHDLENHVMEKSAQIDSLQIELKQVNNYHISSEKVASNAIFELNKVREDMEVQEKIRLDQAGYVDLLETELKQLRFELENVKSEMEKSKEEENEAQVEIAMLKFELHRGRAKLAAAEAAETRAQGQKSALYNALQQMGLEAEEMNKEKNRLLKELMQLGDEGESSHQEDYQEHEDDEVSRDGPQDLIENVEENKDGREMEKVNRELEVALSKIGELRTRAEQAISRAEAAEKAKGVLEEQIRKRKEHKERRRAALAALREESIARDDNNAIKHDISAKNYQPLGKVLNMKF